MQSVDIIDRFYSYLAGVPGLPDVVFHDNDKKRADEYIQPTWLPARTASPAIGFGEHIEQRGLFQIDCVIPAGPLAERDCAIIADTVAAAFPRGSGVVPGLQLTAEPQITPIRQSGGFEVRSVTVEYTIVG